MLSTNIFLKYKNKYFIETGSYMGDGISNVIEAGFDHIYSIELADKYYNICKNKFSTNPNVHIIKGDSCEMLSEVMKDINEPITFWLDGHYSCDDTALGKYWSPLLQELEQIKYHPIKTHTIIIDDMRCWLEPNPVHGFYTPDIINKLMEINKDYELIYEDGYNPKDILVAKIK